MKKGYINYYFGKATIIHFKGESTLKDKTYSKRFYGAMEIFYRKHFANSNVLSFLVKIGLKLAAMRNTVKPTELITADKCVVISDKIFNGVKSKLNRSITFTKKLDDLPNNAQIIFDTSFIDFKSMINYMKVHGYSNQNTYRFLLKSSNFILGSDSNLGKGEVITLD